MMSLRGMRRLLAGALMSAAAASIPPSVASADSGSSASELEKAIHDYIMKNPKVIREALQKAEREEQLEQNKYVLKSYSEKLYQGGSPILGTADAKITIVEFYDYNCPYCRKVHADLMAFIAKHPDTRIVNKDIASFGKDSEAVARLALAAARQGKFAEMHGALMTSKGKANEATGIELARKLGLDIDRLKADAASPATAKQIDDTRALANALGVAGTPLFIIGHNGIPGAPDNLMSEIEKFAAEVRSNGCEVC